MERKLRERWTILSPLREGEVWTVYAAMDDRAGVEVEVDEVSLENLSSPERERLVRLVEVSASLGARCFVPLLEWWTEEGRLFIVRGKVPGVYLWEWLESNRPPEPSLAISLARAVGDAASDLYGRGCFYLGMSPMRILVSEGMEVFLEGGAYAWLLEDLEPRVYDLLESYRAPEVKRGEEGGRPSDVYSLALLVHELLPVESLSSRLSGFLESCLERLPGSRPTSPRLLLEVLEEEIAGVRAEDLGGDGEGREFLDSREREPFSSRLVRGSSTRPGKGGSFPGLALPGRILRKGDGTTWSSGGARAGNLRLSSRANRAFLVTFVLLVAVLAIPAFSGGKEKPEGETPGAGVKASSRVRLPELVGLSLEEALELISGLGLQAQVRESPSSLWSEGTVCASDPPPGSLLAPGDRLVLSVSKGWPGNTGGSGLRGADPADGNASVSASLGGSLQRDGGEGGGAVSRSPATSPSGDGVGTTGSGKANFTGSTGNRPPVARPSASPAKGPAPLTVILDASGSFDPDGRITRYRWECGDGTVLFGRVVCHVYDTAVLPGTFPVVLRVTDDRGAESSARLSVTVF